jgi:hypothetical protein
LSGFFQGFSSSSVFCWISNALEVQAFGRQVHFVEVEVIVVLENRGHHVDAHAKVESHVGAILGVKALIGSTERAPLRVSMNSQQTLRMLP